MRIRVREPQQHVCPRGPEFHCIYTINVKYSANIISEEKRAKKVYQQQVLGTWICQYCTFMRAISSRILCKRSFLYLTK